MTYDRMVSLVLGAALGCQGASGTTPSTPAATVAVPTPARDAVTPARPDPIQLGCDAFPSELPRYRIGSPDGSQELEEGTIVARELLPDQDISDETGGPAARVAAAADVNSDRRTDYILSIGELVDDSFYSDCNNYAECVLGLYVTCSPNVAVEMIRADYRAFLGFGDSWTRLEGTPWRDGVEVVRKAISQADEAELMERGEELTYQVIWRRRPEGYRGERRQ
jgi:hypothetical protein